MAGSRGRWLSGRLSVASILQPKAVAQAVFHPAWIPPTVDPSVERLKRVRVIAGAVAAFGVYTFVEGRFDFTEVLENIVVAALVLLFITPLTVGVMLFVWRRTGRIRELRGALFNSLKLLLLFVAMVVGMGVVLILGAPVAVTSIVALEATRLRRRYGIRLGAHPATLPPLPAPQPYAPNPGFVPPQQGHPYAPPEPYAPPGPYVPPGPPYPPGNGNPYASAPPQPPYGS